MIRGLAFRRDARAGDGLAGKSAISGARHTRFGGIPPRPSPLGGRGCLGRRLPGARIRVRRGPCRRLTGTGSCTAPSRTETSSRLWTSEYLSRCRSVQGLRLKLDRRARRRPHFRLLAVLALYLLGRRFGRLAGLAAGAIGAALLAGSASATAESEALALALVSLVVAAAAASRPTRARWDWWMCASGRCRSCAVFRLEFAPAVILSALPLLLLEDRAPGSLRRGPRHWPPPVRPDWDCRRCDQVAPKFSDLRHTGHDRRLPVPGLSSEGGRLLIVWLAAALLLLTVGIWQSRVEKPNRTPPAPRAGLFAVAMIPFGLWQVDPAHIIAAGTVPLSFLPIVAGLFTGAGRESVRH